ncbi:DJ-1/PfpI family protein [Arthrobacter bambusae]|uniref:DJ-1/PfpI family protein n=1 Tax=Arthrobacter bambusae TaxID=1338426 RepID=UPI0027D80F02|nr:DJ-1/PfpI family protein [Arthrobacter bambusae]
MSVCAGAQVLAATDVLNGRHATSFRSDIDGLRHSHPKTIWESGVRWVEDGNVITTAGVSSGIAGSLHLVEQYAGVKAATSIAATVGYPAWRPGPPEQMPVNEISPADYPYALAATLPGFQPTYAIGLTPGVDEIAVAVSAELYGGASFLAHTIPVAQDDTISTKYGFVLVATTIARAPHIDRLIVPGATHTSLHIDGAPTFLPQAKQQDGQSAFDPIFQDIAQLAGADVAFTAAKYIEYPLSDIHSDAPFPPRISILIAATLIAAVTVASLPFVVAKTRKRIKGTR